MLPLNIMFCRIFQAERIMQGVCINQFDGSIASGRKYGDSTPRLLPDMEELRQVEWEKNSCDKESWGGFHIRFFFERALRFCLGFCFMHRPQGSTFQGISQEHRIHTLRSTNLYKPLFGLVRIMTVLHFKAILHRWCPRTCPRLPGTAQNEGVEQVTRVSTLRHTFLCPRIINLIKLP